ncbi:tryptophan-rich sensory protein [Microbacterium galbinum]|uniref:tryptophan-rich sensory protein n=1 Tax=Microbacterium galbinum TaxID=2851646 RepID=UPI001FFCAAF4|nr:tryptophan-rich sensory protein [Microbacterium galbinum]MCK2029793.1 tryptophan-rich sensory protein [Microbacterium galbinum]
MESQTKGIARQSLIIAAASFMLIAAAVGAGAFGGASVDDLQDGALSAQGSYLAPAGPAFSIWSLIYIGLLAYTVWQALPAQRADARQRAVGGWIAASMVLNGLWLVTARFLTLWLTVIVIALLVAVLARVIVLLGRFPAKNLADRILTDGANGLHFGWVTIATVANTAAWFTQIAPADWADQADVWAVAVLVVVAVIGVAAALVTGRIAPALATAWGLVWLAVGRFTDAPESVPTGIAALVVAVVLVLAGVIGVVRGRAAR